MQDHIEVNGRQPALYLSADVCFGTPRKLSHRAVKGLSILEAQGSETEDLTCCHSVQPLSDLFNTWHMYLEAVASVEWCALIYSQRCHIEFSNHQEHASVCVL